MARSLAIVHDIPGRIRLRGIAPAQLARAAQAVRELAGVSSCQVSARTGSLLVHYHPGDTEPAAIVEAVSAEAAMDGTAVDLRPPPASRDGSHVASAVVTAVGEMDRRIGRFTGGALGLRILLPLGLVAWALREIAVGRAGPLAWSAALWYAHGLFRDYSVSGGSEAPVP